MKSLFESQGISQSELSDIIFANIGESNKTFNWRSSDSEVTFKDNVKAGQKLFWVDKKIEYKYNNEGFRVPYNFNDKDSGIVTLGCSFTEGVGLPYEYTWGYKLAKHLNVKHWQLAQGSMGLDTAYRLLLAWHKKLIINQVFLFVPPMFRNEFIINDNNLIKIYLDQGEDVSFIHTLGTDLGRQIFAKIKPGYETFFKSMIFGSNKNEIMRQMRGISAITGLCSKIGVPIHYQTHKVFNTAPNHKIASEIPDEICPDIPARDQHWGAKAQHLIYTNFLKLYENNNG
jgi:hypothetical protein|tara:strand:+ start:369 stop:1226 length:858 start_codon:yes stop_codon:yes gene_type:complete